MTIFAPFAHETAYMTAFSIQITVQYSH